MIQIEFVNNKLIKVYIEAKQTVFLMDKETFEDFKQMFNIHNYEEVKKLDMSGDKFIVDVLPSPTGYVFQTFGLQQ